jgi:hypothetical protein
MPADTVIKGQTIQWKKFEDNRRRTDNIMAKREKYKRQTTIYKTYT